jgi:hypothetical protein
VIDAQVPADADDPRLEVRPPVERGERLEDLQEDVLREVFRFDVFADELVRDVEDLAPVLPDDRLPRVLIATETPLDEAVGRRRLRGGEINGHAFGSRQIGGKPPESYQIKGHIYTLAAPKRNARGRVR